MHARHVSAPLKPRRHQRGQALAEFTIAAAFVLIPLFLMIPLLGKFLDMKATTIQAARYAAWERTAWYGNSDWAVGQKSDAQIQSEVQQRFFADAPTAPLRSTDQTPSSAVGGKPLWHDHAGQSMLTSYSAGAGNGTQTPGTLDAVFGWVTEAVNSIGSVLGTQFKLDMESLYTSTVNLNTAQTSAVSLATGADQSGFRAPNFVMNQVLVANGWSANGPDFVKKQTEGLAPLSLGQRDPVKQIVSTIQKFAGTIVEELKDDSLRLGGVIKPDDVPPDRLTAVPAGAPAPSKTAAQRRQEEAAKREAEAKSIGDTFNAKTNALNDAITNTRNQINTCKADKQAEYDANRQTCRTSTSKECSYWVVRTEDCLPDSIITTTTTTCTLNSPPNGGSSYTPNADASVACHAGLDAQIADLQAKLNDPDLQRAKTDSDKQLKEHPELANNALFMKQRKEALDALKAYQDKIDDLKRQKNGI